jgi:hypothetical protein
MAPQQFREVAEETASAIRSLREAAEGLAAKLTAIEADFQPDSAMVLRLGTLAYGGIKLMDTTQAATTLESAITRGRQHLEKHPASNWVFPGHWGRPLQPRANRQSVPSRGKGGRPQGFPLPRSSAPWRNDGAQQGLYRADRHGFGRLEDRADDAAVCSGNRPNATRGSGGSQWSTAGRSASRTGVVAKRRDCLVHARGA